MPEDLSIKMMLQSLVSAGNVTVLLGIVKSVNPLKIQMVNDEKLIIGPSITYVPRHLTDYDTYIDIVQEGGSVDSKTKVDGSHDHEYSGVTDSSSAHMHSYRGVTQPTAHQHALQTFNIYKAKIKVHNALQVGEKVHILAFNQGKQYYVLDREAL